MKQKRLLSRAYKDRAFMHNYLSIYFHFSCKNIDVNMIRN